MKQGHRLSCKHLTVISAFAILAVSSQCLISVCVCRGGVEKGGVILQWETGRSRQKTDSMESLQLFLHGRRGELLIECECTGF